MNFGKKRQCVEWYTSTRQGDEFYETYKNAILGFVSKFGPWIFFGALFMTGAPWWLPQNPKNQITMTLCGYILFFLGIILIILISISFVYIRYQKKGNILISLFHDIIHKTREIYCESLILLNNPQKENTISVNEIVNLLCSDIRNYFTKLKRSDEIGVAIRLASKNGENEVVYETTGCANLDQERRSTSEGIPENTGIPAYFKKNNFSGILIYNDIETAIAQNLFKPTKNEEMYKGEIQSFIVAH